MNLEELVQNGHLTRIGRSQDLADKEFRESLIDLGEAEKEFDSKGYKWAIIKAYYSMFHSAKAIIFLLGYKERSYYVVGEVLGLLSKQGKLEDRYVNYFKAAMSAREGADYHYQYDVRVAEEILFFADEFTKRMRDLAKKI